MARAFPPPRSRGPRRALVARNLSACALGLLAVGLLGATTSGAAAAGFTPIHGCYGKSTGVVRIVSSTAKCRTNEGSVTWFVFDPRGPRGAQGLTGAAGLTGPTGPQGLQGVVLSLIHI